MSISEALKAAALEKIADLERQNARLRDALSRIADHRLVIEGEFKIVTGYEEAMIEIAEEAIDTDSDNR